MVGAPAWEVTPPLVIRRVGRYTVFITPPTTLKPSEAPRPQFDSPSPSQGMRPLSLRQSPHLPVGGGTPACPGSARAPSGSLFGFLWDAVTKVEDGFFFIVAVQVLLFFIVAFCSAFKPFLVGFSAHSSLDEYLTDYFGLNHYQWASNDYYENNGVRIRAWMSTWRTSSG